MNTVSRLYFRSWRPAVLVLSLLLVAYLLYFHRLGGLLPGYSAPELTTYGTAASWHTIATDPTNAPYNVFVWLLTAILHHGIITTRIVSAGFGIAAVLMFYAIIRPWYGFRTVFLGTLLFATSAGLLHIARLGSGHVLQLGLLAAIAATLWYRRQPEHRILIGYCAALLFALLLYVPGMVWFELVGLLLLHRRVLRQLRQVSAPHLVGWALAAVLATIPLLLAGFRSPHIFLAVAGLPEHLSALSHAGSNTVNALMSIGVRSDGNPLWWVGHTPLLGSVELVLGIIGGYYYLYRQRSRRGFFLAGFGVLATILLGLGSLTSFAYLVPLAYLFIVHGLDNLLGQWLTVFPRNPIARAAGIGLICVMLAFSILYQTRSYFVAWPHHAATRQAFGHPEPQ